MMRKDGRRHDGRKREGSPIWGTLRWLRETVENYGLVLVLLLVSFVVAMVQGGRAWAQVLTIALYGSTLVLALVVANASRIWLSIAIGAVTVSTLLAVDISLGGVSRQSTAIIAILGLLLITMVPILILRNILRNNEVTAQLLFGALSVYLLFGVFFAMLYAMLDYIIPGRFFMDMPPAELSDYLFYSYDTLTTVGYGRLVPVDNLTRAVAMIEGMLGQLYLFVIIAQLVSQWKPGRRGGRQEQ